MENKELIKRAVDFIDTHFQDTKLSLEEVARNAGFSVDYFNRVFRAHTGFNVMEYIRFRTLSDAALALRRSDKDILEIALRAGYETHDGFTRAFKLQYSKTPSEYRAAMRTIPVTFADLGRNATAAATFQNACPDFSLLNSDTAIDHLLSVNPHRFAWEAVSIKWNGSCVFTDGDIDETGCMVAFDSFFKEGPYFRLKLKSAIDLSRYLHALLPMKPYRIEARFEEDVKGDEIEAMLKDIRHKKLEVRPEAMYFGEAFSLPATAAKYTYRFLDATDMDAVKDFAAAAIPRGDWGLSHTLSVPRDMRPDDQPVGMFDGSTLIGVARTSPLEAHGMKLNTEITPLMLPAYRTGEEAAWLYRGTANLIMDEGYLLFEELPATEQATISKPDVLDLGFETVNTMYLIEF